MSELRSFREGLNGIPIDGVGANAPIIFTQKICGVPIERDLSSNTDKFIVVVDTLLLNNLQDNGIYPVKWTLLSSKSLSWVIKNR